MLNLRLLAREFAGRIDPRGGGHAEVGFGQLRNESKHYSTRFSSRHRCPPNISSHQIRPCRFLRRLGSKVGGK
jgi:hypothetical protein